MAPRILDDYGWPDGVVGHILTILVGFVILIAIVVVAAVAPTVAIVVFWLVVASMIAWIVGMFAVNGFGWLRKRSRRD